MLHDGGTIFLNTLLRANFNFCVNRGRCTVEMDLLE